MRTRLAALLLALAIPAVAAAETPEKAGDDPIARNVFPPDLVMKHQQEIGLTDKQQDAIKSEMQKVQSKFLDLQWQMQKEMEKLVSLIQARPVDEAKALAQADALMRLETDTKKAHLGMLLRIKNLLTAEQQEKLSQRREPASK